MGSYNWLIPAGDSVFTDDAQGTPWHKSVIYLDHFCGQQISIWWDFGSNNRTNEFGWYLDNIAILEPNTLLAVEEYNAAKPEKLELKITPNPFNTTCRITVNNNDINKLTIRDISGRTIVTYSIQKGYKEIYWDASDCCSGIYLIEAENSFGKRVVTRGILLK
jgi:hypothetical protein